MSRDGSSGGVIRLAVITKDGVERMFVPGDQLPGILKRDRQRERDRNKESKRERKV